MNNSYSANEPGSIFSSDDLFNYYLDTDSITEECM